MGRIFEFGLQGPHKDKDLKRLVQSLLKSVRRLNKVRNISLLSNAIQNPLLNRFLTYNCRNVHIYEVDSILNPDFDPMARFLKKTTNNFGQSGG